MESAIQTVVGVFLKSAKGKESLGGKDFQNLVKSQLQNIMTDTDSSDAIKEMRQGLDANQDGKVSFQEYMTLVGYLANTLSQQHRLCPKEPRATRCGTYPYDMYPSSRASHASADGNAQDKDAVDKVMGDLDANNDGEVDFTEFIILVGALTVACNDFFNDKKPEEKK
ncbi:hypothetical protein JZ751_000147 [Albula glossodonta]|uniref:EF-hand domain-containing protein n=1 Tax=Albula glossodonta TaxID=121402 RepID=A0A8T2PVB4_9TELE|nr:hypothetical protein JZ751_000147 [Albula glossodonta]